MNKVILVGRLTKDPELRATAQGTPVCSFTVACDRRFVKDGEERKTDFINCIAWRQSAEAVSKYFAKGHRIALLGTIQVRNWQDNNGKTQYATEVIVDEWEFAQSKSEVAAKAQQTLEPIGQADNLDGFIPIEEDDLPF